MRQDAVFTVLQGKTKMPLPMEFTTETKRTQSEATWTQNVPYSEE